MRRFRHLWLLLFVAASACHSSQAPDRATDGSSQGAVTAAKVEAALATSAERAQNAAVQDASYNTAPSSPLCDVSDSVVFSCPLAKATQVVSVCAASSARGGEPRFYYASGAPGAIDLHFPPKGNPDNAAFSRTHLGFAGNTGGYAYSFVNDGYKYIVYSISGSGGKHKGGVIVQPPTGRGPAKDLACRSSAITETSDDAVIDATLRLGKDASIRFHGLPQTR